MSKRQEMIRALRTAVVNPGKPLSRSMYSRRIGFNGPESSEIVYVFGSWEAALEAAGVTDDSTFDQKTVSARPIRIKLDGTPVGTKFIPRRTYSAPGKAPLLTAPERLHFLRDLRKGRKLSVDTDEQLAEKLSERLGIKIISSTIKTMQAGRRGIRTDEAEAIASVLGFHFENPCQEDVIPNS